MAPPAVDHTIVLAHPDQDSFCASVARCWLERAQKHHQTGTVLDLYAEGFDPILKANERPGKPDYAPPPRFLPSATGSLEPTSSCWSIRCGSAPCPPCSRVISSGCSATPRAMSGTSPTSVR
ncbi:NAD(P)H-dependent oxidoreductase [Sphingobium yanoikuyae]|uniref:NAD(P)H-dependent oxidoreductase n=1 Tax=Sphingobium TaxID=165695 RepID=UPI003BAC4433